MNTCLAKPVKRFFSDYLPVQKGLAANTVAAYRDAFKLLLCYAADTRKKAVEELAVEDLDKALVLAFWTIWKLSANAVPERGTRGLRRSGPSSASWPAKTPCCCPSARPSARFP